MGNASLDRYAFPDPYTLEEFRRAYESTDAKGRIRLLQKLNASEHSEDYGLARELALLAVGDGHVEVRQWIARYGKSLDDSQVERLRGDADPFVRACVLENETLFLARETEFAHATHLERLALLRNPTAAGMPVELLEKIFDPNNPELGIDQEARRQLILAFLTNERALTDKDPMTGTPHHDSLWTLIAKWPRDFDACELKRLVYRFVKADDTTKAEVYRACQDAALREAILYACGERDRRTIALGLSDPDDSCYSAARDKKKGRWERRLGLAGGHKEKALPRDIQAAESDFLVLHKRLARIEAQLRAARRSLGVVLSLVLFGLAAGFVVSQWTWTWTFLAGIAAIPVVVVWLLAFLWARCREYQRYVGLGGTRGFLSYWPWRFERTRRWRDVEADMAIYRERDSD